MKQMTSSTLATPSSSALWTGHVLSALAVLFLLLDAVMKLMKAPPVLEAMTKLGYPDVAFALGAVLLLATVLYAIPNTAVLGAILLTGYLGGAVATHVRVGDPLFSHTLFPVYLGIFVWGGLWLRDVGMRTFIPTRTHLS